MNADVHGETVVKRKTTVCSVVAVIWLAGAGVVAAQDFRPPPPAFDGLPPFEIVTIVRSLGLNPVNRPVRQGASYVLRAVDEYNREMRVVVDARSGRVRSAVPVVPANAWRESPGFGDDARLPPRGRSGGRGNPNWSVDPDDEADIAPPPGAGPNVIRAPREVDNGAAPRPNSQIARTRAASAAPGYPPVPRPRRGAPAAESGDGGEPSAQGSPAAPVNPLW